MHKDSITVWLTTHCMFPSPGAPPELPPGPRPFCFRDYPLAETIHALFKFARSVRLIPRDVEAAHCYFWAELAEDGHPKQHSHPAERGVESMRDEGEEAEEHERERGRIHEDIMGSLRQPHEARLEYHSLEVTLSRVVKEALRARTSLAQSQSSQLRICILWKEAYLQLKSHPSKMARHLVSKHETFDDLYRRLLVQHSIQHAAEIKSIAFCSGPDCRQYHLSRRRHYPAKQAQDSTSDDSTGSQAKSFTMRPPNARITLADGLFRLLPL